MDCVVVAGGRPTPEDPLYAYTRGQPKALITLNGRTMLEYVVNGLQAAGRLEEIVVAGLVPDNQQEFAFSRPVTFLPDQGSLYQNVRAGMEWCLAQRPEERLIMVCSADIPLVRGPLVDAFIEQCRPLDRLGYYSLIRREIMEQRFPGSQRTFVKLKGETVAGGDIALVHSSLIKKGDIWGEAMAGARKQAWKLVRLLGFRFLLKYFLHRLSVGDIEEAAERISGEPLKIIFLAHPELAMDADKPSQVELLRSQLPGGEQDA